MQEYPEILIVDDVPEQIAFAGALLREEGYRVSAVPSGTAALKFLEKRHPDLIMLDIKMEDIDGLEVCQRLKRNSLTKDIPIIFLTAQTNPEIIKRGFELGGCDYVIKPFLREEYLARVKMHLRISQQSHALVAANRELNLFCSAVSHDLKSPLNVINLLISALKDSLGETTPAESMEIMDMISEKSQKLIVMIERLLEFSKMCNVRPEMQTLDVRALIEDVFQELCQLEPTRDIQLLCDPLPAIQGDDLLMRMLFKNLLSNAIKFTRHKDHALITVTCRNDPIYHIVTVSDNGSGFDMAYADKLFQIFQRLHTDEEFEGTGVGLALSDRIMRRHGGKIEAYGEVDKGASFSLYFLRQLPENTDREPAETPVKTSSKKGWCCNT